MTYQIRYALGGGFGGCKNVEWEDCAADTLAEAEEDAYARAVEVFESYEGLYGLRTVDDIQEDEDVDEDTAWEIYVEERESWLDYEAREKSE